MHSSQPEDKTSTRPARPDAVVRVPTILQMEAVECGAAALAMVLAHYRRWVSLEVLRQDCHVTQNGVNASEILKAARQYGLEAKAYKVDIDMLARHTMPCIIYWGLNHFVVLEGYHDGQWRINDPALGRRAISEEEFNRYYTGVMLDLVPGKDFERGGSKPSVVRSLAARFRGSAKALQFCVFAGILLIIPGIVLPTLTKIFVDEILIDKFSNWLEPLLIALGITAIVRAVLTWLESHYLLRMETRIALDTSAYFLWHLLHLPLGFFGQRLPGDLVQRVHSNDTVASILSSRLAGTLISFIAVLAYLVVLLSYDVWLTLISLATISLSFIAVVYSNRARAEESKRLQQEFGRQMGVLMSGFGSIDTVKAGGREFDLFNLWSGHQATTVGFSQRLGVFTTWLQSVPLLLQHLVINAAVLGFGGWQVIRGTLTVGDLAAIQSLVASCIGPFSKLVDMAQRLQTVQADVSRLDDVLVCPPEDGLELTEPEDALQSRFVERLEDGPAPIRFEGVSAGGTQGGERGVVDLDFEVEAGSMTVIIGTMNSGADGIGRLAVGLDKPDSGTIRIGDESIADIDAVVLTQICGFVDSAPILFNGTVHDNVSLFSPWIDHEDVRSATRFVGMHDEIMSRSGGYQTMVLEGGRNFSGGQKQRLEIARAIAKSCSLYVLDEPTAALDYEAEAFILERLRSLPATKLLVTNRVSVTRKADRVLVVSNGKLVEQGTHDELMSQGGRYSLLVEAQST